MEGFKKAVRFESAQRVVAGNNIARFAPGEVRHVNEQLFRAALALGAEDMSESEPAHALSAAGVTIADKPKRKTRRRSTKTKTPTFEARDEPGIVNDAMEFIEANQDKWDSVKDYDPSGIPRMNLFKENVPGLTTALRDQAWDLYLTTVRQL